MHSNEAQDCLLAEKWSTKQKQRQEKRLDKHHQLPHLCKIWVKMSYLFNCKSYIYVLLRLMQCSVCIKSIMWKGPFTRQATIPINVSSDRVGRRHEKTPEVSIHSWTHVMMNAKNVDCGIGHWQPILILDKSLHALVNLQAFCQEHRYIQATHNLLQNMAS